MRFSVVAATVLASCSGNDEPFRPEADGSPPMASMVNASLISTWGQGRALVARSAGDGSVNVVATTTGLYLSGGAGEPPRELTIDLGDLTQIRSMVLSADARYLAIARSNTAVVNVWDLSTEKSVIQFELDADDLVQEIGFANGGTDLMVGSRHAVTVWDIGSGVPTATPLDVGTGELGIPAILDDDGTIVVPVTSDSTIAVRRAAAAQATTFPVSVGENGQVIGVNISPDRSVIAVSVATDRSDFEGNVQVLDSTSMEQSASIPAGASLAREQWVVTDSRVVIAQPSGLAAFDLAGEPAGKLDVSSDSPIFRLIATPTGFVSLHADGTLDSWNHDATNRRPLLPGNIALVDVSVDAPVDGVAPTVTAVDFDGRVTRFDLATGEIVSDELRFAVGSASSVGFDETGDVIAIGNSVGRVSVVSNDLSELTWSVDQQHGKVDGVAFDETGERVVSAVAERLGPTTFDDTVAIWNTGDSSQIATLGGEAESVAGCSNFQNRIRFTSIRDRFAVPSHDYTVQIVEAATGAPAYVVRTPSTVLDLAYSTQDDVLVTSGEDSFVRIWNTSDYSLEAEFPSAMGGYWAIAFLPDDTTLATVDVVGTVRLIDSTTGSVERELSEPVRGASSIAVSPDGRLIAAGGNDATVSVWSAGNGNLLATLTGHTSSVTDLAFSPDGTQLVTASLDGTVRLWSIQTSV